MVFSKKKKIDSILVKSSNQNKKRTLNWLDLMIIAIGSMIGSGVFVFTGNVACFHAGPAVLISYVLAGIASLFAGFMHIEVASKLPTKGGLYDYGYVSFGQAFAWFVFSCSMIELLFGIGYTASTLTHFLINYINSCKMFVIPAWIEFSQIPLLGNIFSIPVLIVVAPISFTLYFGIMGGNLVRKSLFIIKILSIIIFVAFSCKYSDLSNLSPFVPLGWKGVFVGASIVFVCYYGFAPLVVLIDECKNPKKDFLIGSIGSVLICIVIYGVVSILILSLDSYANLGGVTRILDILAYHKSYLALAMLYICSISSMIFILLFLLYAALQVIQYVALDKLLPEFLTKKVTLLILLTFIISFLCKFLDPLTLAQISSIGICMNYMLISIFALFFRTRMKIKGSFKSPLLFLISPGMFLLTVYLIVQQILDDKNIAWSCLIVFVLFFGYYLLRTLFCKSITYKKVT